MAAAHRVRFKPLGGTLACVLTRAWAIWNCLKEKNHTCKVPFSMILHARIVYAPDHCCSAVACAGNAPLDPRAIPKAPHGAFAAISQLHGGVDVGFEAIIPGRVPAPATRIYIYI